MRFTFTAEGETVEEEDWQDDDEDEEIESSKQEKDGSITKMSDFPTFKWSTLLFLPSSIHDNAV